MAGRKKPKKMRDNFSLIVRSLEIAAADDGLLRGDPEPVLVLAAFHVHDGKAWNLGRKVVRVTARMPRIPGTLELLPVVEMAVAIPNDEGIVLCLVCALEEDGGADVKRVYAALAETGELALWESAQAMPEPRTFAAFAAQATGRCHVVQVLEGARNWDERCEDDQLLGVCAVISREVSDHAPVRLHFVSADRRNDWLVNAEISRG